MSSNTPLPDSAPAHPTPGASASSPRWRAAVVVVLGVVALSWTAGWRGVDFGTHWDEWYHTQGVARGIKDASLLPHEYTYNGIYFGLGFAMLVPRALPHMAAVKKDLDEKVERPLKLSQHRAIKKMQKDLTRYVKGQTYLLRTRLLFMTLSLLGIFFTYLLGRELFPRRPLVGVVAAAFVGLSWEVVYHSRFIAVDGLMLSLTAACFWQLARLTRAPDEAAAWRPLVLASVCGGLLLGCKATGVFASVPITVAVLVRAGLPGRGGAGAWMAHTGKRLFAAGAIFVLVFFVTTPGAFLEPVRFYGAIAFERLSYREGVDRGFNVEGFFDCVKLHAYWIFAVVPSRWPWLASACSLVGVLGLVIGVRLRPRWGAAAAAFVLVHTLFVCTSTQLVVRNSLMLVPLLGTCFGLGVDAVGRRLSRPLRVVGVVLLACVAVANAAWLFYAAETIVDTTRDSILDDVAAAMQEDPGPWLVSPQLVEALRGRIQASYVCDPEKPAADATRVLAFAVDTHKFNWRANRPEIIERVWSSLEVNYDHYPNWRARRYEHRVVELGVAGAKSVKMNLKRFVRCQKL